MTQYPNFSTSAQLIAAVRQRCRLPSNPPSDGLKNPAMYDALHDENEQFVNYTSHIGALPWKFLRRETLFQSKAKTTLASAYTAGGTTLALTDGDDFDDPADAEVGAGYIRTSNWAVDYFAYEDKDSDELQVVNNLSINHAASSVVHKLYPLPANYGKPRRLFVDGVPYDYEDMDFNQIPIYQKFTTNYFESTSGFLKTFAILPEDIGEHDCTLYYIKRANTISSSGTDKVDAPHGSARMYLIHRMRAYVWMIRGETDEEAKAIKMADDAISKFMDEQAFQSAEPEQDPDYDM